MTDVSAEAVINGSEQCALLHSDCRGFTPTLADESVDCIVTDPPYGISHDSNRVGSEWAKQIVGDESVDTSWLPEAARILKSNRAMYVFTRWDVEHEWITAIRATGLTVVQSIVWDRGTHGAGDLNGMYGYAHERILFATKGRHLLNRPRMDDVWRVPAIFTREWKWHPHEKPQKLLEIPVLASSNPGELVVDLFAGSGSTLAACLATGRRVIGCEIDAKWHEWATSRLAGAERRDPGNAVGKKQGALDFGGGR